MPETTRWWRFYRTSTGSAPVREFLTAQDDEVRRAIVYAMKRTAQLGRSSARHLSGDIYEVRVSVGGRAFRVLFAAEGRRHQVLLGLSSFEKKTQKTPDRELELAQRRLRDWHERGR